MQRNAHVVAGAAGDDLIQAAGLIGFAWEPLPGLSGTSWYGTQTWVGYSYGSGLVVFASDGLEAGVPAAAVSLSFTFSSGAQATQDDLHPGSSHWVWSPTRGGLLAIDLMGALPDGGEFAMTSGSVMESRTIDAERDLRSGSRVEGRWLPLPGDVPLDVQAGAGADTVLGGDARDRVKGGDGADLLQGGAGRDTIDGQRGDDLILGGEGKDIASGGSGSDTLFGGEGNDTLYGFVGDDLAEGEADRDHLLGGEGADTLRGGAERDTLDGGEAEDDLAGGTEADDLYGGAGADLLRGEEGNDYLAGGDGADTLEGGVGGDVLRGEGGDDRIFGGLGADFLSGSGGADTLHGGGDADRFWISSGQTVTILDFDAGEGDRLDLRGLGVVPASVSVTTFGTGVEVALRIPGGVELLARLIAPDMSGAWLLT
jgi:Ca2+-binding RTX toxin-like protein